MLSKDAMRAFCEFAAFMWLISMLYHAGDGNIHNGLRRVCAHYVRMHQQRRSNKRLIPAQLPDGVEWRTRAMHAALCAIAEPPYHDAMAMMLTWLFQSPGNRLGKTDVSEPCRGEVRLQGPGKNAQARRLSAAAVQHAGLLLGAGEARINRRVPSAAIDLTESNDLESGETGTGNARATRSKIAPANGVRGDPPSLELSNSDLQRIDESVSKFRAKDGK